MRFCLNHFLSAVSFVLDYAEHDVFGVPLNHGKRVAYIAWRIGQRIGLGDDDIFDLVSLAILHDIGLSKYIGNKERIADFANYEVIQGHCVIGEQSIKKYPFLKKEKNIILYHHEHLDGSGFFHISGQDLPLKAQIISFADYIDTHFQADKFYGAYADRARQRILSMRERQYAAPLCDAFLELSRRPCYRLDQRPENIYRCLHRGIPERTVDMSYDDLIWITEIMSDIIDAKSRFTWRHSKGLAEKAGTMAGFYEYDSVQHTKLVIAANLHDLGKLLIPNRILEANRALTEDEFALIQSHTYYTRQVLSQIDGFEDITEWASNHHEKLDGSGYPYGKTAAQLDFNSRLMGCLDIYQALTEDRPYREGMPHAKAVGIMRDLAVSGRIDANIVRDVQSVFGG